MGQGKVETNRVFRIEPAQARRHFQSHLPVSGAAVRQAEQAGDPRRMRIEGKNQAGRRNRPPETEVDAVVGASYNFV